MRWQVWARRAIGVAGLGTAVAVYVMTRPRPVDERPPSNAGRDPNAIAESGRGTYVRTEGGRQAGVIEFENQKTYADGRVTWIKARFTLEDGTTLSADSVEGAGKAAGDQPNDLTLKGNAKLQTGDGTVLQGESGTYSNVTGIADIPGPASFSRGRMSGGGTGGTYDRSTGAFKLLADAKVTIAPEAPQGRPIEITARSMTFVRAGRQVVFEEQARIVRRAETLSANHATVHLSEDEQRFDAIDLRGSSRVEPTLGQSSDIPDMQAEDISLGFHADGQALQRAALNGRSSLVMTSAAGRRSIEAPRINLTMAPDGKTLTRLDAAERVIVKTPASQGVPERTITSTTLVATGTEQDGLTAALFDGNAEFTERIGAARGRAESERKGRSEVLTLILKGQLDAIDEAKFQRNVKFQSGDVTGDADLGIYRASKGELELRPDRTPRRSPHVSDGTMTVDASEFITIDLDTQDLHASKDVKTASGGASGARGGGAASAGIFNTRERLYGSGHEFWYTAGSKLVRYAGQPGTAAQLRQGDSTVIGGEITFEESTQNLTARRDVDTTFLMSGASASGSAKAAERYRIAADELVYRDGARTATYKGTPAILKSTKGGSNAVSTEVTATTLVLVLAKTERALERLEPTGSVHLTLEGGREARGDTLVYDVPGDSYTLRGRPLTLKTKDAEGTCSIQTGRFARFVGAVGAPDFPSAENPSVESQPKQPCAALTKP